MHLFDDIKTFFFGNGTEAEQTESQTSEDGQPDCEQDKSFWSALKDKVFAEANHTSSIELNAHGHIPNNVLAMYDHEKKMAIIDKLSQVETRLR